MVPWANVSLPQTAYRSVQPFFGAHGHRHGPINRTRSIYRSMVIVTKRQATPSVVIACI